MENEISINLWIIGFGLVGLVLYRIVVYFVNKIPH